MCVCVQKIFLNIQKKQLTVISSKKWEEKLVFLLYTFLLFEMFAICFCYFHNTK